MSCHPRDSELLPRHTVMLFCFPREVSEAYVSQTSHSLVLLPHTCLCMHLACSSSSIRQRLGYVAQWLEVQSVARQLMVAIHWLCGLKEIDSSSGQQPCLFRNGNSISHVRSGDSQLSISTTELDPQFSFYFLLKESLNGPTWSGIFSPPSPAFQVVVIRGRSPTLGWEPEIDFIVFWRQALAVSH